MKQIQVINQMNIIFYHLDPNSKSIWKKPLYYSEVPGLETFSNTNTKENILGKFLEVTEKVTGKVAIKKEHTQEFLTNKKILLTNKNNFETWMNNYVTESSKRQVTELILRDWVENSSFVVVD